MAFQAPFTVPISGIASVFRCGQIGFKTCFRLAIPTGYSVAASDRQKVVIAQLLDEQGAIENRIVAIQSAGYSLVPNGLIRDVVEALVPEYELQLLSTPSHEYAMQVILPDVAVVGSEQIQKCIMFRNSHNGKTRFSVQGRAAHKKTQTVVKVSFYRQIGSNGLFGWADQFLSMDEYLTWLTQPDAQRAKTKTAVVEREMTTDEALIVQSIFTHRDSCLDRLKTYLTTAIGGVIDYQMNLSVDIYRPIQTVSTDNALIKEIGRKVKIPVELINEAIGRMEYEQGVLGTEPNLWLAYNGLNHALLSQESSLSISERYALDEAVFHTFAALSLQ